RRRRIRTPVLPTLHCPASAICAASPADTFPLSPPNNLAAFGRRSCGETPAPAAAPLLDPRNAPAARADTARPSVPDAPPPPSLPLLSLARDHTHAASPPSASRKTAAGRRRAAGLWRPECRRHRPLESIPLPHAQTDPLPAPAHAATRVAASASPPTAF